MDSARFQKVLGAIHKVIKSDKVDHPSYLHVLLTPLQKEMGESVFGPVIQKMLRVSYVSINKYQISFELPLDRDLEISTPIFAKVSDICTFLSKAKPKQGEVVHLKSKTVPTKDTEDTEDVLVLGYRQADAEKNRIEIEISCANLNQRPPALEDLGEDQSTIEINTPYFLQSLSRAKVMVSEDEARVALCHVCFYSSGKTVTMASTDGHRLYKSVCDMVLEGSLKVATHVDDALLIAPEVVKVLLSELDSSSSFTMTVTPKSFCRIQQGDMTVEILNDCGGRFPDFSMVLPSLKSRHIIFDLPVMDAVECCDLIKTFPDSEKLMRLCMAGEGTSLLASGAKVKQEMAIVRVSSDLNFRFVLNADYFKDALVTLMPDGVKKAKSVRLHFWDTLSPIVVDGEGCDPKILEEFVVVMPMRL